MMNNDCPAYRTEKVFLYLYMVSLFSHLPFLFQGLGASPVLLWGVPRGRECPPRMRHQLCRALRSYCSSAFTPSQSWEHLDVSFWAAIPLPWLIDGWSIWKCMLASGLLWVIKHVSWEWHETEQKKSSCLLKWRLGGMQTFLWLCACEVNSDTSERFCRCADCCTITQLFLWNNLLCGKKNYLNFSSFEERNVAIISMKKYNLSFMKE